MNLTCYDCAHFRKTGGAKWGRCKVPVPVWLTEVKPKIITYPDDPALAPNCRTFVKKTGGPAITADALNKLLFRHRFAGRTADAVRLVLINGYSQAGAARQLGIHKSAVTRMLHKLARSGACPACGQTYRVGPTELPADEVPALPPLWPPLATELERAAGNT